MLPRNGSWIVSLAILGILCGACQSKTSEAPTPQKSNVPKTTPDATTSQPVPTDTKQIAAPTHKVLPQRPKSQPIAPPTIAKVLLSGALSETCLVKVGDALPEAALPDAAGKSHTLGSLLGPKLSVVCFWTIGPDHRSQLTAPEVLQDLMKEVVEPFGARGVQVIGVNVGNQPDVVQQEIAQTGVTFPVLLDAQGELYAQVAKDRKMPRIFLVDAGGRVLWFDIENSRQTREDLLQSIHAVLGKL
ncbi:MAG: peroxiredoxin family protein [Planctomycetaceae bacterium]|nr:peroxiredoxin family protein [Planctomycetaceae bacterium]